ncbi:MAG: hypothetical protein DRJ06_01540 [Candidatus Aminicenantes bacterium]|nr:MAG: hypothetical protein DRJ06_01540 [Candidatus Aminicenantes bacterium]
MEWLIFILDEKGYILQMKRRKVLWNQLPATQLGTKLSLSPGQYKLRTVFRDIKAGQAALSTTWIAITQKDQVIKKSKSISPPW